MATVDAAEVLAKYSRCLAARRTTISDVRLLPYPKEVIGRVLTEGLLRFKDEESRTLLGNALLALADFQPLTPAEEAATKAMASIGQYENASDSELAEAANLIASHSATFEAILERQRSELAELQSVVRRTLSA